MNEFTTFLNQNSWLGWLIVFILTLLHEMGWIAYIRGISHKKLTWALLGNAWIICSGVLTTILVLQNIPSVFAAMCGGVVGILLVWHKLTED